LIDEIFFNWFEYYKSWIIEQRLIVQRQDIDLLIIEFVKQNKLYKCKGVNLNLQYYLFGIGYIKGLMEVAKSSLMKTNERI
jgi:hypothetical protein